MSTLNIPLLNRRSKGFQKLLPFASCHCAMINSQWLELPISRTIFQDPKMFEPEVRLYVKELRCLNVYGICTEKNLQMSMNVRQCTFLHVCPAKTQISLALLQSTPSLRCPHEETLHPWLY